MKYVRYEHQRRVSNGILDGETVREIQGGLFEGKAETGNRLDLRSVKLLWPCDPGKVLAVGLNYKSHLGNRPAPTGWPGSPCGSDRYTRSPFGFCQCLQAR